MAASSAIQASFGLSKPLRHKEFCPRSSMKSIVAALPNLYSDSPAMGTGLTNKTQRLRLKPKDKKSHVSCNPSYGRIPIEAKKENPPIMPAVITPGGPLDLTTVLFRNRIIFIGQPINSMVAERVISQLVTLTAIDDEADILIYLNCPGGSAYSVFAIYDCMSWIKPKVGTVAFGMVASHAALILAGGEKGMRYAMPNARIMIHQPHSGTGGHMEAVMIQAKEAVQTRHKIDRMYAAFSGQPRHRVQYYTDRDCYLSAAEALDFGLIDGLMETEY